uniref:Uncharacterized protein n=1 Tax=viral metagenome TaxID=1070528 RepID=A0A6H1Z880_9ZZZZ
MANSFTGNPVVLDTFTSAIDVCSSLGFSTGTPLKVKSIEWQTPTSTAHTAAITDAVGGNAIFGEQCTTANQSIIKYFDGYIKNLCIAISGVGSGKIIIHLA